MVVIFTMLHEIFDVNGRRKSSSLESERWDVLGNSGKICGRDGGDGGGGSSNSRIKRGHCNVIVGKTSCDYTCVFIIHFMWFSCGI